MKQWGAPWHLDHTHLLRPTLWVTCWRLVVFHFSNWQFSAKQILNVLSPKHWSGGAKKFIKVTMQLYLLSNAFEQLNICLRHALRKMTIFGKSFTNSVISSTMLQNSLSIQQNCLTPSNPQLLSTILRTVRHFYTRTENLIKLLDNQQNEFEMKKERKKIKFTSASPPLTPQPCFFL